MFAEPMAEFQVKLTHMWSSDGKFEEFEAQNEQIMREENSDSE